VHLQPGSTTICWAASKGGMTSRVREMIVPPSLSSGGLVRCNASRTAHVAGDAAGGCCFLPCLKSFCIRSLGCAAGRTEPARRALTPILLTGTQHSQPEATPRDASAGRSRRRRRGEGAAGGAEPGLAAAARRGRRSGGMRQCRAAGLAALAAVLLGARGWRRRGWGCGGFFPI